MVDTGKHGSGHVGIFQLVFYRLTGMGKFSRGDVCRVSILPRKLVAAFESLL